MATNFVKKIANSPLRRSGIKERNGIGYRYHIVRINSVNDASIYRVKFRVQ